MKNYLDRYLKGSKDEMDLLPLVGFLLVQELTPEGLEIFKSLIREDPYKLRAGLLQQFSDEIPCGRCRLNDQPKGCGPMITTVEYSYLPNQRGSEGNKNDIGPGLEYRIISNVKEVVGLFLFPCQYSFLPAGFDRNFLN